MSKPARFGARVRRRRLERVAVRRPGRRTWSRRRRHRLLEVAEGEVGVLQGARRRRPATPRRRRAAGRSSSRAPCRRPTRSRPARRSARSSGRWTRRPASSPRRRRAVPEPVVGSGAAVAGAPEPLRAAAIPPTSAAAASSSATARGAGRPCGGRPGAPARPASSGAEQRRDLGVVEPQRLAGGAGVMPSRPELARAVRAPDRWRSASATQPNSSSDREPALPARQLRKRVLDLSAPVS